MREFKHNLGDPETYAPTALVSKYSPEAVQKEYTRMRKNLMRNIDRIKANGEFPDVDVVKSIKEFEPASAYKDDPLRMAMKLSQLEKVLSANTSTLSGLQRQRADVIDTLQGRGYHQINKSNFNDFVKFMDSTRTIALNILRYKYDKYGNPVGEDRTKRLELFNAAQRKSISMKAITEDFEYFINHLDEIKQLPDRKTKRKLGTVAIQNRLEEMKNNKKGV